MVPGQDDAGSEGEASVAPRCDDGVRNGNETDVDCGGGCGPCEPCFRCKAATDCKTGNCMNGGCGPALDALPDASPARRELLATVATVESGMRCDIGIYLDVVGVVGRESYRFSEKEPRYTSDLLGEGTATLDPTAFYIVRPWASRYWVARTARRLLEVTAPEITDAEKKGFAGFARTIIAHELLMNVNLSDTNGLRLDFDDTSKPPNTKDEVFEHIAGLLESAKADLAGASFAFTLSRGFSGFTTPETFLAWSRALAARVAGYRGRWAETKTLLDPLVLEFGSDLSLGVSYVYDADRPNPLFLPPSAPGEARVVHPSFAADLTSGDRRAGKATPRTPAASQAGLESDRDFSLYTSATASIPLLRSAEVILLLAEAEAEVGSLERGRELVNVIRAAAGIELLTTPLPSKDDLFEAIFDQRRYELFMEGHRWIDLRRRGRLAVLPKDRPEDDVWSAFPIPPDEALH